jgi:hypothetical protein
MRRRRPRGYSKATLQRGEQLSKEGPNGKRPVRADQGLRPGPGPSSDFADLKGTATVTGVGFFDVKHSTPQTGVAPNNIELHPVLRLSGASCSR